MNRLPRERGQALIEFAFVIPVLALLALGVMDFAIAIQQAMLVEEAATEGAMYGSFTTYNATQSSLTQTAATASGIGASGLKTPVVTQFCTCGPGGSTVSCTSSCYGDDPMMYVQVTVSSKFNSLFPFSMLPSSFNLSSTVVMPVK